jgi:hypothetical protein
MHWKLFPIALLADLPIVNQASAFLLRVLILSHLEHGLLENIAFRGVYFYIDEEIVRLIYMQIRFLFHCYFMEMFFLRS